MNNLQKIEKKICITGTTGFIGKATKLFFEKNGFNIISISRTDIQKGELHVSSMIENCEMIINLAGAPIQKKWTYSYKNELYNSRILSTRILVNAIKICKNKPKTFISTSAVGIYNNIDIHDEFSDKLSNSFLGNLCKDWENEALKLTTEKELKLVIFRLGVVLGKNGGAFPKIIKPFRFFAGTKIGDGFQWFPYVHIDDVLSAFWFIFVNKQANGIYNLVTPNLASYNVFCNTLSKIIKRPYWFKIPNFALKLLYGESSTILTEGQHVKPHRLIREGFYFQYPTVEKTIKALI
ncbi:MAG: TIGR01777 family oxidoreductase [Marinilabiliaceae bacterium]|nr:TIGR01777 family oxidoreductase [Marinilabiliaceae bacterium]